MGTTCAQMSLFDTPRAHRNDPITSYKAAEHAGRTARAHRQQIAEFLCRHNIMDAAHAMTTAEMAYAMGLERHVPARRMSEMMVREFRVDGVRYRVRTGGRRQCAACRNECMTYYLEAQTT